MLKRPTMRQLWVGHTDIQTDTVRCDCVQYCADCTGASNNLKEWSAEQSESLLMNKIKS